MKKTISLLLCLIMLVSFASCEIGKKDPNDLPDGTVDPTAVVMSTENFSVTNAELCYLFSNYYATQLTQAQNAYGTQYKDYLLAYSGIDVDKDLKSQNTPDGTGTWFDYFVEYVESEATDVLLFCEYARENGIELDESELEDIDSLISQIESNSVSNGCTVAELYGDATGMTDLAVIKSYFEKYFLANKAYEQLRATYEFTDEEIDEEFKRDPKYGLVTYLAFTFESNGEDITVDTVKTRGDGIASATSETEFIEKAKDCYENVVTANKDDADPFDADSLKNENVPYSEGTEYLDWMFDGAKAGDAKAIYSSDGVSCTVYYLVSAPAEVEYDTKSVRHILFQSTSYSSVEECKNKALAVLDEFNADPTSEHFTELVKKYSEDTASVEAGGLYENIRLDQTVADFENWAFDEARKPGDTGLVLSSFGYHIMYFVGNGIHVAEGHEKAESALVAAKYAADHETLEAKYSVTVNDADFRTIDK